MSLAPNATTAAADGVICGSSAAQSQVESEDPTAFFLCLIPLEVVFVATWVFFFWWHGSSSFAFYRSIKHRHLWESRCQNVCFIFRRRRRNANETESDFSADASGQEMLGSLRKRRLCGAISLLAWRLVIFAWFVGMWGRVYAENTPEDFFYFMTFWTYTLTWVYFLLAAVMSVRGIAAILLLPRIQQQQHESTCMKCFLPGVLGLQTQKLASLGALHSNKDGSEASTGQVEDVSTIEPSFGDPTDAGLDWLGKVFVLLYESTFFQVRLLRAAERPPLCCCLCVPLHSFNTWL